MGDKNALIGIAEWVNHWTGLLVGGGTLIAVLIGPRVAPAVSRWRDGIWAAFMRPFAAGARAEALAREVLAELRPNGGMSLRDAVSRVEERQVRFQAQMGFVLRRTADEVATWETDADGLCVYASKAYLKMCGRTFSELAGWGWVVAVHTDDIDAVRQDWRLAVEERRQFERHMRVVHADGTVTPVVSRAVPLTAAGKLVGWSGVWEVDQ